MLTAGPARPTSTAWLRGWRRRLTETGTGFAHPKATCTVKISRIGRRIVPNEVDVLERVERQASGVFRRVVAAQFATAPWLTSCKMIEGIRTTKYQTSIGLMRVPVHASTTIAMTTAIPTRIHGPYLVEAAPASLRGERHGLR